MKKYESSYEKTYNIYDESMFNINQIMIYV